MCHNRDRAARIVKAAIDWDAALTKWTRFAMGDSDEPIEDYEAEYDRLWHEVEELEDVLREAISGSL